MGTPFRGIQDKIGWLKRNCEPRKLIEFEHQFNFLMQTHCFDLAELTSTAVGALQIDILYCIAKNYRWIDTPLFWEILEGDLVETYKVSDASSKSLVEGLVSRNIELFRHGDTARAAQTPQDFVLYLSVVCLACFDETSLEMELGFGHALRTHLREIVRSETSSAENKILGSQRESLRPLFRKSMRAIKAAKADCFWAVDCYLLEYQLGGIYKSGDGYLESGREKIVFDLLVYIGLHGPVSLDNIESKYISTQSEPISSRWLEKFLSECRKANLLYSVSHSRKKCYSLTDRAFSVTGFYFAKTNDSLAEDFEQFLKLDPIWQKKCIRFSWDKISATLLQIAVQDKVLDPEVIADASLKLNLNARNDQDSSLP